MPRLRSGLNLNKTSFNIDEETVTCEAIVNANKIPNEIGWFTETMASLKVKSFQKTLGSSLINMTSTLKWNGLNKKFYRNATGLLCCIIIDKNYICTAPVSILTKSINISQDVISRSTQSENLFKFNFFFFFNFNFLLFLILIFYFF